MENTFYLKCSGDAYALQLYDCETLEEAEIKACEFLGVEELPEDCEVW